MDPYLYDRVSKRYGSIIGSVETFTYSWCGRDSHIFAAVALRNTLCRGKSEIYPNREKSLIFCIPKFAIAHASKIRDLLKLADAPSHRTDDRVGKAQSMNLKRTLSSLFTGESHHEEFSRIQRPAIVSDPLLLFHFSHTPRYFAPIIHTAPAGIENRLHHDGKHSHVFIEHAM